ncbi:cytochrome P450 [Bradyrhizobium sp. CCBAU 53421]|uniref:cytochrome P450 n=1 Tax=Bradyrhizobium sp. CCBAU 53421 TaxID=1325120 RepID=UPI00188DB472|nr:cytochrome P450 [Bradyrhizobium sp. CCBAU 53421]
MLALAGQDPFPAYDLLRKKGRVVWDQGMNCWLVLTYDLCKQVESDEGTYRITYADAPPLVFEIRGGEGLSALVGERHARMRRVYLKLLAPSAMPRYRDQHILPIINETIDRFADEGSVELVSQFCEPITGKVMASLFGLPWQDDALLNDMAGWHRDIVAWIGMKYFGEELTRKAKLACKELNAILLPHILERRHNRGSDFVSLVWSQAEKDCGEVEVEDVLGVVRELALGAGENTANATANAIYLLLANSAVREAVTSDQDGALNAFVEETFRLLGSVQFRYRVANRDVSLGDATIKKDDTICLVHAAANRDSDHYGCPHMVDLGRPRLTDHLAFNVGPRVCVGMHLARLEVRESLKALITRCPDLRLDPSKEAPRFLDFYHRYFGPLHTLF